MACMGEERNEYGLSVVRPGVRDISKRVRLKYEDIIKMDFRGLG